MIFFNMHNPAEIRFWNVFRSNRAEMRVVKEYPPKILTKAHERLKNNYIMLTLIIPYDIALYFNNSIRIIHVLYIKYEYRIFCIIQRQALNATRSQRPSSWGPPRFLKTFAIPTTTREILDVERYERGHLVKINNYSVYPDRFMLRNFSGRSAGSQPQS